jgi:hypothetical protein
VVGGWQAVALLRVTSHLVIDGGQQTSLLDLCLPDEDRVLTSPYSSASYHVRTTYPPTTTTTHHHQPPRTNHHDHHHDPTTTSHLSFVATASHTRHHPPQVDGEAELLVLDGPLEPSFMWAPASVHSPALDVSLLPLRLPLLLHARARP